MDRKDEGEMGNPLPDGDSETVIWRALQSIFLDSKDKHGGLIQPRPGKVDLDFDKPEIRIFSLCS
jgi:hypothetical protein